MSSMPAAEVAAAEMGSRCMLSTISLSPPLLSIPLSPYTKALRLVLGTVVQVHTLEAEWYKMQAMAGNVDG